MLKLLLFYPTEPVDELAKMVTDLFADVVDKNVTIPDWPEHPVGPEQVKVINYFN